MGPYAERFSLRIRALRGKVLIENTGPYAAMFLLKIRTLTELQPITAVDIEVVVTGLPLPAEGIEHQTVGAEPFLGYPILTVVELVALFRVFEVSVRLGATE